VVFGATAINITTERHKHLGAAIGSRSYFEEYVGESKKLRTGLARL